MSERDLTVIERDRIAEWDRASVGRAERAGEPVARRCRRLGGDPPGRRGGALRGRFLPPPDRSGRPRRRRRAHPHGRRHRALDLVSPWRPLRDGRHVVGGRGAGRLGNDCHGGERSGHRRRGGRCGHRALGGLGAAGRRHGEPDPSSDRAAAPAPHLRAARDPRRALGRCARRGRRPAHGRLGARWSVGGLVAHPVSARQLVRPQLLSRSGVRLPARRRLRRADLDRGFGRDAARSVSQRRAGRSFTARRCWRSTTRF